MSKFFDGKADQIEIRNPEDVLAVITFWEVELQGQSQVARSTQTKA